MKMEEEVGTPESIRRQYAAPPHETPEERRRRLANRRAAKYRFLRSQVPARLEDQREKSSARQRSRRQRLDEATRARIREQNRQRQQLRRQRLSDDARESVRVAQRQRQQQKRQRLGEDARKELRERERVRLRLRRQLEREADGRQSPELQHEEAEASRSDASALQQQQQQQQQQTRQETRLETRLPQLRVHSGPSVRRPMPGLGDRTNVQLPSVSDARGANSASRRLGKEIPALHAPPRHRHQMPAARIPFGRQFSLPPPPPPPPLSSAVPSGISNQPTRAGAAISFPERVRSLPHLQVALPQASALLHPPPPALLMMPVPPAAGSLPAGNLASSLAGPGAVPASATTGALGSGSSSLTLPMGQPPLAPIVLPPAHRSLPPLPDFLNSREVFDPASAASSSSFFQTRSDQAGEYHNV